MRSVLEGGEGVMRGGRSVRFNDKEDAFDRRPSIEELLDVRDLGGVVACSFVSSAMPASVAAVKEQMCWMFGRKAREAVIEPARVSLKGQIN